jgi:hypothetical protein
MIQNELKEMLGESPRKQQLQRELDGIYRQLGGTAPAPSQGAPAVGTVMQGYRFKGGNPADRNNWEKV